MSTLFRTTRTTMLVAGILIVNALAASAQTFTLSIPNRNPGNDPLTNSNLPTAVIKVTLQMSGSPAGSTLKIDDASPISILDGSQVVTTSFGTDFVRFRTRPNNQLEILVTLTSNLNAASNFCILKGGLTFPQSRTLVLTAPGGVTVVSNRLTSYAALSTFQCTCPSRRVSTNAASWAVAPPGASTQRHPLDIVVVLDRSGSMGDFPSGGAEPKMDILKWAVKQFITTWQAEDGAPPEDRLAVVWFESGVTVGSAFVRRDVANGWANIKTAIQAQTTANSTALGDGVSKGLQLLKDPMDLQRNDDGALVLMTNGIQNSGNQIQPGNQVGIPDSADLACFDLIKNGWELLRNECIPMQTIGVGAPGNYQADLLDKIALQTGGAAGYNLGTTMDFAFMQALVNVFKGSTMSTLAQIEGSLGPTETASAPHPFELDGSVRQGIIVLGWRRGSLFLQIRDPNGTVVTPDRQLDDPFFTVQTVRLPASGPPGTWSVTVNKVVITEPAGEAAGPSTVDAQPPPPTPYHLSFIVVEGRLDFTPQFRLVTHRAGAAIDVEVVVGRDRKPLTGLDKTITARRFAPPKGLGNLLHDQAVGPAILSTDPPGLHGEAPNAPGVRYQRKLQHLLSTTALLQDVTPVEVFPPLTFRDDGHGADRKADDGVYSARVTNTKIPGKYEFKINLDFTSPGTGRLRRHEEPETTVRLKADPNNTTIVASGDKTGTTRTLTIEPADPFGNFLGPGYDQFIRVNVQGGGSVTSIVDPAEDGHYVVTIGGVTPNTDPDISVIIDGEIIYEGPASAPGLGLPRGAVFFGLGGNVPTGTLASTYNGGFSLQAGTEFMLAKRFSVEGVFGYDRFSGSPDDLSVTQLSARAKVYASIANPRVAAFAGVGWYLLDPGDSEVGTSVGGVAEFRVAPGWSVEATYTFHNVNTPGSATRFSALHGGFRLRF